MAKAPHGDGFGFDGLSNILAHAFYPPPCGVPNAGDLHFDLCVRKRGAGDGGHMGLPRFLMSSDERIAFPIEAGAQYVVMVKSFEGAGPFDLRVETVEA